MTYDMYSVAGDLHFGANASLMGMLRDAIVQSGVKLDRHADRWRLAADGGARRPGDLLTCFLSNDGLAVTPEECLEIAERVDAALPRWIADPLIVEGHGLERYQSARELGADDRTTGLAQQFTAFCRKAAKLGGFCVW